MSNPKQTLWIPSLIGAAAAYMQPQIAFASVGAGAGLPYEETFAKIVTSLTGPWAWTVAIVCVVIFAYNAIQRGGDLGGSTTAFLGPAFICTLLLGAKKLMSFFGQGALITTPASMMALGAMFALGIIAGLMMLAPVTFQLYRSLRHRVVVHANGPTAQLVSDPAQLSLFAPPPSGQSVVPLLVPQPSAADLRSWPQRELSKDN